MKYDYSKTIYEIAPWKLKCLGKGEELFSVKEMVAN